MGMETQPELSNPPKESDFVDRISLGYVDQVDSGFFGRIFRSDFRFSGFDRDFLIPTHKAIIMKEKSNLYLEGYNGRSGPVLLSSRGLRGDRLVPLLFYLVLVCFQISACQTWDKSVLSHPVQCTKRTLRTLKDLNASPHLSTPFCLGYKHSYTCIT